MEKTFLKAEWRKLAFANYCVNPQLLKEYLPFKTELDFWEDRCYLSLVGFMFKNVKVLGMRIPFHLHFEEVNLRFYVKFKDGDEWKRGVVFIKELVPKPAIALVANTLYGENYQSMPMRHEWKAADDGRLEVSYGWKTGGNWDSFSVTAVNEATDLETGSEQEFITQHFWGYTRLGEKSTLEYHVEHPAWKLYTVEDYNICVSGDKLYGQPFGQILAQCPESVYLAEGSEIVVRKGRKISPLQGLNPV